MAYHVVGHDDSAAQSAEECSDGGVKVEERPAKRLRLEPAQANGVCHI